MSQLVASCGAGQDLFVRIEYPGAAYHVLCRGNRGDVVLGAEAEATLFLRTLGEGAARTGFFVHVCVLMSTHYNLLLETPEGNLAQSMKWVQGLLAQRYNLLHHKCGQLFQERCRAKVVDGAVAAVQTP